MAPTLRSNRILAFLCLCFLVRTLTGCGGPALTPAQHEAAARELFNTTVKQYHLPSVVATGEAQARLLEQAAAGYQKLIKEHPAQPVWCAQALRSLGNVRASQGRIDEAAELYRSVGQRYPGQEWDTLQALKAGGDTLWDAGRHAAAREFYQSITQRFDRPDAPLIFQTVVRGARTHLEDQTPAASKPAAN
jgi:tetratricopeptide (TPR) repeat protein